MAPSCHTVCHRPLTAGEAAGAVGEAQERQGRGMLRGSAHKALCTRKGDSKMAFAHLSGVGRGGQHPATVLHGQRYGFC